MRVGAWVLVTCLLGLQICHAAAKADESSAQVEVRDLLQDGIGAHFPLGKKDTS